MTTLDPYQEWAETVETMYPEPGSVPALRLTHLLTAERMLLRLFEDGVVQAEAYGENEHGGPYVICGRDGRTPMDPHELVVLDTIGEDDL